MPKKRAPNYKLDFAEGRVTDSHGRPVIFVFCSALWHMEVEEGISVRRVELPGDPPGKILFAQNETGIAIDPNYQNHVATVKNTGDGRDREWVIRLAKGISAERTDSTSREVILRAENLNHHIIPFGLDAPAEIAFLVTPVPPLDDRKSITSAKKGVLPIEKPKKG